MDNIAHSERDTVLDTLLLDLADRDIRLKVTAGRLGYDAPPGAFTDTLKDRVQTLRPELIARLTAAAPAADSVTAPLSCGQERMWYLNRLEIQSAAGCYTEHLAYALAGPLDRRALEGALAAIVARHGALRCRFRDDPTGPVQVIVPPTPFVLPVIDLTATPDRLDAWLEAAAHRTIDLGDDDHVRFTLLTLGTNRHVLSVSAHHAGWDGWSNGVFATDLATAYNALHAGLEPSLPPLVRQIADLARQQRQALAESRLDAPLQRLCRSLAGFPTRLDLPADHPRADVADGRGAAIMVRAEPDVAEALAAAGRQAGVTPAMTLMAAFALWLSRISGAGRLLIGVPVAARDDAAAEAVIGYLSNTLAVPVDIEQATSFGALAIQVRDTLLEIMNAQQVPFEKLVETIAPPRSRATTPLIQAVFSMQPRTTPAPDLQDLDVAVVPSHNHGARYELMLNLEKTLDGGLEGPLTYAASLFDAPTVQRWTDDFLVLLRAIPQIWAQPLDRAPRAVEPAAPIARQTTEDRGFITATERALAAIWSEFLQTAPTDRHDDFFMLGGHSLLLMRMVNRINTSDLGRITLVDALGATTVAGMAARIDGQAADMLIVQRAESGEYPASGAQEGMWLARRDDPDSVTWAVPLLIDLPRHADPALVRDALARLAARHPALRTTLAVRDGDIIQRVAPPGPVELTVHRGLDDAGRVAFMRQELARPMNVVRGPLYRFDLFADDGQEGSDRGALFLIADHSMIDGWSLDVLRRDFIALLDAVAAGRQTDDLAVLVTSPADVAVRQREMLAGPRGVELRRHWLQTLDGLHLGECPAPGRRPPGAGRRGRRTLVEVSATAVSALDRLAASHGTTATVAFLAIVATLLARLKGDGREVSVVTPFVGRPDPELADLIGCFVEVLPLRLSCPLDQPFATHLAATRRALLNALANQDYPLCRLSDDWLRAMGGEPQPLYDAVVVVEEAPAQIRDWFDPHLGAGKYDLAFALSRLPASEGGGVLVIEHDEWLYDERDARDLAARLDVLLMDAAANPTRALGDLTLLPDQELKLVTTGFNQTAAVYPDDSLATLWSQAARQHATRTALIAPDETRTSYAALDRWAEDVAGGLLASGTVGPVIALAMARGPAAIAAILAIWKIGSAYLPIDAKMPPAIVERLMADTGSRIILGDAEGTDRLAGLAGVTILRVDALTVAAEAEVPLPPTDGGSTAYVMFTSGTTGQPKGVVVPHRGIARLALAEARMHLSPDDVMAQTAPLAFDATTLEIWPPLLNGAALRIFADEELHDLQSFGATLRRDGVTVMWLTAAQFNRIADEAPGVLASLHRIIVGGEVLSPPHLRLVTGACPGIALQNGYGPTENTCLTTLHAITTADLDDAIPIGRPVANSRVYIVDQRLNPLPIGSWGELVCAGDGLAEGYAGRPDLTAQAFVTLPWPARAAAPERVYRTGDIARWRRDGIIEFQGRRDGQIKIRGHRIEITAIEATLAACPDIADAAVVVIGEGGDKALIACVVVATPNGETADAAAAAAAGREGAWRRHLADRLPLYMMPARFLVLPALPTTANGKRDRRALAALAGTTSKAPSVVASAPPETDLERLVIRKFALLFPGTAIDRTSDFFHLGGHSLLAMRLSSHLEAECGTRLPLRALFAARTVATIARLLDNSAEEVTPPPSPPIVSAAPAAAATADYPLSCGQERLWVMQRLYPQSPVYNVPLAFEIEGTLDVGALTRALLALEERHHALRLRVIDDAKRGPRQRLVPVGGLSPALTDVSDTDDPSAAAEARMTDETMRPFRLDSENGARAILVKLAPTCWRILLVLHHAISDGWSVDILLRDLAAFYSRERGLPDAPPAAPKMQFEDVAVWQRGLLASVDGQAVLSRWVERLTPLPEPLPLPIDHHRPPVRNFHGGIAIFSFDKARSRDLDGLARGEAATPFALVTALVQVLLFRMTGKTDLVLGTLVSGRDRPMVEDTVGFLVNTLVLRQTVDEAAGFERHLAATREVCLQAIADQHCPFETLIEAIGLPRDLSHNPLFDVLVVWQSGDSAPPSLPGLTLRPLSPSFPYAKFDLAFHFGRNDDGIVCQIEYSTDLFEAETIAALFARLDTLAGSVLADRDRPLATIAILPEAERRLVVESFNATRRTQDTERSLLRPFLDRAVLSPDRPAVIWDGGSFDYRQFAARAGGVARRLAAAGVRPGDTVAVLARRSPELLVAIYGVLMSGAAYAPLGADHPPARIAAMLEDLGHPPVLASAECRRLVTDGTAGVLDLATGEEGPPLDLGGPALLAYVIFTSGSTGRPKGVAIEQRSVLNRLLWLQNTLSIGPGDVILQKTPITFDVSVPELFWWAGNGATVALPPPGAERDPTALAGLIERHRVTHVHFVPSMLAAFLTCVDDGRIDAGGLKSLRQVFSSGEELHPAQAALFDRLLYRPYGIHLQNFYGPTETTVDVTWQPCSPWNGDDRVSIGTPTANTTIYILDGEGCPAPVGIAGEIHIGGAQLARGYVNRLDLTAEKFIPDPFAAGGRLYRTGDLGRWRRNGTVDFLGRIDDQVKIRGQRIEPGEIERALETHPSVERAIVVAAAEQELTELHGYVLLRRAVSADTLRAHLRERVTEAMIPSRWFRLDSVPLTANGKLDRKTLKGVPLDGDDQVPDAGPDLAPDAVEAEVRAIWKSVLPAATPGATDGFFQIGGNSLLLVRLHERLDARWPGRFTITDLFASATIAAQVGRITGDAPPLSGATAARRPAEEDGIPVGRTVPEAGVAPPPLAPTLTADAGTAGKFSSHAVAIVGIGIRLSGSQGIDEFWRDVAAGADRVRSLPPTREADIRGLAALLDQTAPVRFRDGGYLDDVFGFDPQRFRMSPADASLLDPEQRLFLDTALQALENAGRGGNALDRKRVGVFVGGVSDNTWRNAVMRGATPERIEQVSTLNVPSNVATRLSFLHDWRGPAALVDTACSASLVALHQACRALRGGECDWALVGGAKVVLIPPSADEKLTIYSSNGRTRAFADGADGTGIGEGAAAFLLRPLAAALADNDAIHAVILGSAVNQDGASSGMAAPNPAAQAEVILAAAQDAGVPLASLSYIEAHGTGTALGDPVEIDGLTRAFAAETGGPALIGTALVGSGKGNYGHLDAAAGALGLSRAVMCLTHDQAPPQPFFTTPNQRINFAGAPVAVSRSLAPLAERGGRRRAGVSAFGLSGINAHVIIEAAPPWQAAERSAEWTALGISAATEEDLRSYAEAIVETLRQHPEWPLATIAGTLTNGREPLAARLAMAVRDRGDMMSRLAVYAVAPEKAASLVITGIAERGQGNRAVIAVGNDEKEVRAAAQAFVAGARLLWPDTSPAGRVHLPAAPLTRQRMMPTLIHPAPRAPARGGFWAPPVVTAQGRFHTVDVHAPAFWPVAEHRLDGKPTLVGMAFPALLAEACPGTALRISRLRWVRPLRPETLEPGTVTLSIGTDGKASLDGRTTDGLWQSFATATVEVDGGVTPPMTPPMTIDIEAIGRRCAPPAEAPAFSGKGGVVDVSDRWDCLEAVAIGSDESLAWLKAPRNDGVPLRLHPALLDVAASQALRVPGLVPAGCEDIVVTGPLPPDPVAHVVFRPLGTEGIEADLWLADRATGVVGLTIRGLCFVPIDTGSAIGSIVPSVPVWRDHPLGIPDALLADTPVVVIGEGPLAERIATYVAASGHLAGRAGSGAIDAATQATIGGAGRPAIVLAPAGGPDIGLRTTAAMRAILTALRHPTRLLGIGEGAFAVGDDGPLAPDLALVYGILTAAALEEPLLSCRYVDTDDVTDAAALLGELAVLERPEDRLCHAIAWRQGRRLLRTFAPIGKTSRPIVWPDHGCCVVSGGTGGLSLFQAETLTNGGRVALALLSRNGTPGGPEPEAALRRQRLADLRAAGLKIEVFACNIGDRAALSATLDWIRRDLGPITAVVHNAGVPDGAVLMQANQSGKSYAQRIDGKVNGARLLDALTEDDPVEAFVMAGSLTALVGAPGQAAYTGANAFLDAFAAKRRRRGKPALTIDWCLIGGMGMAARVMGTQDPGIPTIGAGTVEPLLLWALAADVPQIALMDPAVTKVMAEPPAVVAVPPPPVPPVTTASNGEASLEEILAATWAEVLGYPSVRLDDDFYALGGDSIAGMQIVERAVRVLGLSMTLADLFAAGTVSALAERMRSRTDTPEIVGPHPAPLRDRYPLAWEQLAVLRAEATADMATAHNLPQGLNLPEDVDLATLHRAIDELVARHEILRTRFVRPTGEDDEPTMEILAPAPVTVQRLDFPNTDALDAALKDWVRPFDLWAGVPMRIALGSIGGHPCVLVLDVHHALADAFTMELLLADLNALYAGGPFPAAQVPALQLKDYAWWSRQGEGASGQDDARAYWHDRFQGRLPTFDLPLSRPRPQQRSWRADCIEHVLPAETIRHLRDAAQRWRTTPFTLMTAAWALLLTQTAGCKEMVISVPVNARQHPGMASMAGMLVSLLPLRLTVAATDSVSELILRTHATHADALRHRAYDLGRLLADLAPPPAPDRPLLAEVQLSYMNFAEYAGQRPPAVAMTPFSLTRPEGKSDLGIYVRDLPDQMVMMVEYACDLFDHDQIKQLGLRLCRLLDALTTAPGDCPVLNLIAMTLPAS
ncbi:non-ribosomal peptide synthetase [Telmatospirillum sp.]|uniref:non-ribosomal peptide synthetase n=1 Tax=Telmatospirillum sp. TaxID=2079197 RepID=UPI00284DC4AE|nr:non-ribosomal peptide synthetase [Telmatospirillum sp.]MDR3436280.1 amino acid adenylation domain-containing protein [Telmatospirillum sp.]